MMSFFEALRLKEKLFTNKDNKKKTLYPLIHFYRWTENLELIEYNIITIIFLVITENS